MNVIAKRTLLAYGQQYPDALDPLLKWFEVCRKSDFTCFADVQAVFGFVSWVAPEYLIFNIRGNHYRLITTVDFEYGKIRVKEFLTHTEYDDWKP